MRFTSKVALAKINIVEMAYWSDEPAAKKIYEDTEAAVNGGSIDANLKEKFKKMFAKAWESCRSFGHLAWNNIDYLTNVAPELKIIHTKKKADEEDLPTLIAGWKKIKDSRTAVLLEDMQALFELRKKVNALPVAGEVVKKVKPTFTIPQSTNFTDGSFLQWYTPKAQEAIVQAIPVIDKCIADGYVPKKELRSWAALFGKHEKARAAFHAVEVEYNKDKEWDEQTHYHVYDLHENIPEDKYNKTKYVPEIIKQFIKEFAEVRTVFEKMEDLATKSDKEHKRDVQIKRDWSPAADLLKSKLEDIIKQTIDELEENLFDRYMSGYQREWEQIKESGAKNFGEWEKQWKAKPENRHTYKSAPHREEYWVGKHDSLKGYGEQTLVTTFPKAVMEPKARKKAHADAMYVKEHFVSKNLYKLVSLLKTKKLEDIKVTGVSVERGAIDSVMRFTFDDKSAFTVRNKIVYGYSSLGKFFARYPTTFHEVLVGGKPMPSPSEQKVYLEFSGGEAPVDKPEKEEATSSFKIVVRRKYEIK